MISSGSNGKTVVNYTYDKNGNLLSKESTLKSEKYSYNSQNRLCESIVIDRQNKTQAVSYYGYDAFGRRVVVQDRDEACMRSLYDGFTFDVIKQSPTFANGMFVDSNETGIRLNRTGRATGDRYRYLDDDKNDGNRYFYLDDGNYKSVSSRYVGDRTSITVNGTVAGQNAGGEVSYFTTDLLGSVRTTTDNAGFGTNIYSYDVFGSFVEGELSGATDYGYLGKQFDPQTGLYNYGYRDYAPQVARFTTVDPARDGYNWYAYCSNNPINFLDPTGLWTDNGDGSFTAQKGDTLWGLQQETGRNLNSFDYQGNPESLQIGQTVNVVKAPEKNNHPTIDSTKEAVDHYYNGNGEPVNLGENTINALKNSPEQKYNQKALSEGTAKSEIHRYGVDLTINKGTFHVGDTVVTYDKSEGTKYRVVTYNAFVSDGFWDVLPGKGDGIGPKKELPGGTPYSYIPYSWTEVYKNK